MNIHVGKLVIEVTRRCNMHCDHCLCGDAQEMDMQKATIDKILDKVDSIESVTITGGEPSLNIPLIRYFFEEAEKRGKLPGSFYIVTNGKAHMLDLAHLILDWYAKFEEPELCGVAISQDVFHEIEWEDERNAPVNYLTGLSCYRPDDKKHDYNDWDEWVQSIGRAAENGLGRNTYRNAEGRLSVDIDDDMTDIALLYVAATEKISGNCDMSFAEIDSMPYSIDTLYEAIEAAAED